MPELRCARDDCGRWFEVDPDDVGDDVRCPACGHKQVADPDRTRPTAAESGASSGADDGTDGSGATGRSTADSAGTAPDGAAGGDADHVLAVEGATVTITIQIEVEPAPDDRDA